MSAESTGKRGAPNARLILKRLSGRAENGKESIELGASSRDGVSVKSLGGDERVGCGTRLSGSASGVTAAEAVMAAVTIFSKWIS